MTKKESIETLDSVAATLDRSPVSHCTVWHEFLRLYKKNRSVPPAIPKYTFWNCLEYKNATDSTFKI